LSPGFSRSFFRAASASATGSAGALFAIEPFLLGGRPCCPPGTLGCPPRAPGRAGRAPAGVPGATGAPAPPGLPRTPAGPPLFLFSSLTSPSSVFTRSRVA
jgi:hypothetical protein